MSGAVVIARYLEPLDWLHKVPSSVKVIVYNKGPPLKELPPNAREVFVENVGREAYVYAKYIVDHYDNLPDYVTFTQGTYKDHVTDEDFSALLRGRGLEPTEKALDAPWTATLMQVFGWTEAINYCRGQSMRPAGMPLGEWFLRYIGHPLPSCCPWWKNAIFCVRRDQIVRQPKSKYEGIARTLEHINPETAHYMERFWYVLFNDAPQKCLLWPEV